ncbi:DNA translocase FtsK [Anoxybacillus flavithermus]|uniref:DNA translocase FtsK n=1 Tax=Anoxybacillus flavithermus TaxID=33934 RepID=A0A2G5RR90_9BACL|nr:MULTISPECIES: DNA translocase FtsK [Anoxybacillus]KFZ43181.1 cell division protein FtsK [Anoxybacillus sp. KU2-6(11)]PIC05368.1 DNA translocase FtsK [Anoxybacillus flavithermus]
MGWLKALFRYLFGENDEIKETRRRPPAPKNEYKHVEAKVVYEYPKGKFRFPLIPDEPKERQKVQTNEQKRSSLQIVSFEKKTERIERTVNESRTFRPTDVPSPVFGYKRMERVERKKEHDAVVEFELSIAEKVETNEHVYTQVDESVGRQPVDETNEHVYTQVDELVGRQSVDETNEHVQMPVSEPLHHEEQDVAHEKEAAEEHMEQNEEEETKEQEREEEKTRQRSGVPYNVIMLKQDREKWKQRQEKRSYAFPSLSLLRAPTIQHEGDETWLKEQTDRLNETFKNFNVGATVVHVTQGPTVTRFEVQPELGVKVNKITNLADDIKLNLAAVDIRIEAPIPGKNTIGIEVPNRSSRPVFIREVLQSDEFQQSDSPLTVALGLDISGKPIVTDLKKMPHGLIAGATGSGKSVCMNAMLVSLLYKATPHEVKLLLIDPKMVELAPYNHIPHLVSPVITDAKAATAALKWAVSEMERRYELFAHTGVRDIVRYNGLVRKAQKPEQHLPYIVIVIDELADLMMVAPADVEEAICRIAQKARACGIHLLVATQRPSVDVITGLIKANIPTRIAFSVSSQIDSRTIIDINGAEKLLGRGDMLFLENGKAKPIRLQGNFVSDEEIERVVAHVRQQMEPSYLFQHDELLQQHVQADEDDELFYEACEFVVQQGGASTSSLQRRFRIGYNRAARLIEMMEQRGIVSAPKGSKPRDVLIDEQDLEQLQDTI